MGLRISVSAREVPDPSKSCPVPLPMPPIPQMAAAPLPRFTVSFDVLAAKPPLAPSAHWT